MAVTKPVGSAKPKTARTAKPDARSSAAERSGNDPAVEAWLKAQPAELAPVARRVRALVLAADPRIGESIKWKVPTFEYRGAMASFTSGKQVLGLMFHQGAKLPGKHPLLTGEGDHVRTMRFADVAAADKGAAGIAAAVRAWCQMKDGG